MAKNAGAWVEGSEKNSLNRRLFTWITGALILRAFLDVFMVAAGYGHYAMFNPNSDIFGDSLDQCMAERVITHPLLNDPRVLAWPKLFQHYLFFCPYLGPTITVYAQPPLADLQLMIVAEVVVLTNPLVALAAQIMLYLALIPIIKFVLDGKWRNGGFQNMGLALLMILSYPALVMFDRGNFHSGYASIGTVLYLLTVFTGKSRWIGIIGICYAINVRPNIAIVTIVEFVLAENLGMAVRNIAELAVCSILIAAVAFLIVHRIDPNYTVQAFINAYAVFKNSFILHDVGGLGMSGSLYGGVRAIWSLFGVSPSYNHAAAAVVSAIAVVFVFGYFLLAVESKLTKIEAIFLADAICMLFTPWNAEYHVLKCIAPVLVIAYEVQHRRGDVRTANIWPVLLFLLLLGFAGWFAAGGIMAILLVIGTVSASFALDQSSRFVRGLSANEWMILTSSALIVCPLGSALSNSVEITVLLTMAAIIVAVRCWRRPLDIKAREMMVEHPV